MMGKYGMPSIRLQSVMDSRKIRQSFVRILASLYQPAIDTARDNGFPNSTFQRTSPNHFPARKRKGPVIAEVSNPATKKDLFLA